MSTFANLIGSYVDVRSFAPPGFPRDGQPTHDWQPYIQAAVDYLIAQPVPGDSSPFGQVATLYLSPGDYYISAPIRIVRKVANAQNNPPKYEYMFCSLRLIGDGSAQAAEGLSRIRTNAPDIPAILIQAGIGVVLEHLNILGPNQWTAATNPAIVQAGSTMDAMFGPSGEDALYLYNAGNPGAAIRNSRYSPSAGIAIDPFPTSIAPIDGGYPALASEYLRCVSRGSSAVQICDCWISGFAVGIGISLSGDLLQQNCENISIVDTTIANTYAAIAVGQDQSRNITLRNLDISGSKIGVTCIDYGKGTAPCPSLWGGNVDYAKYLFRTFSFGGGAVIDSVYTELVVSIGLLGGSTNCDPIVFNGCAFNFYATPVVDQSATIPYPTRYPAPGYRLLNMTTATFQGCSFTLGVSKPVNQVAVIVNTEPMWIQNLKNLSFRTCIFYSYPAAYTEGGTTKYIDHPPFWINSYPDRVTFDNCNVSDAYVGSYGGATYSQVNPVRDMNVVINTPMLPGTLYFAVTTMAESLRWVSNGIPFVPLGTVPVTVNSDGSATFTTTNTAALHTGDLIRTMTQYNTPFQGTPWAGDVVEVILGHVRSIDTGTGKVTIEYAPDFVPTGTATHTLYMQYLPRVHLPGTATVQNATTVMVSNGTYWKPNNRIIVSNGTMTPPGTYVTAVNGNDLTLSAPLVGWQANTPYRVYDADIRELSNTKL